MSPMGLAAFNKRKNSKSGIYSFENRPAKLSDDLEAGFKINKTAWDFFISQAPSYKKMVTFWIMSARQEKTRLARLEKLIIASEKQIRLTFM
jgi:uncharacterized protein YdeI (YjbR/CyaY-like superfamily)